jgi:mannosyltransferase OCH1-like enzyme
MAVSPATARRPAQLCRPRNLLLPLAALGFVWMQMAMFTRLRVRAQLAQGSVALEPAPPAALEAESESEAEAVRELERSFLERQLQLADAAGPLEPPADAATARAIPRVIHLSWRVRRLPAAFVTNVLSWMRVHAPDRLARAGAGGRAAAGAALWVVVLWTDAANEALVRHEYPALLELYLSYSPIQRADLCRYLYMQAVGGVYADLDFQSLQPLDALLAQAHALVLGQEPAEHALLLERSPRQLCNAILLSRPRHPLWSSLLGRLGAYALDPDAPASTGPRMLEREAQHYLDVLERGSAAATAVPAAPAAAAARRPPPASELETGATYGGAGAADGVTIARCALFYPRWDEMQRERLREVCAEPALRRLAAQPAPAPAAAALCGRLVASNFSNSIDLSGSLAVHEWSHTWLQEFGLNKVETTDAFNAEAFTGAPAAAVAAVVGAAAGEPRAAAQPLDRQAASEADVAAELAAAPGGAAAFIFAPTSGRLREIHAAIDAARAAQLRRMAAAAAAAAGAAAARQSG